MKINILIVDDSLFMRRLIRDILTKEGYNVVAEAESAEDAVVKYKELKPDLVTMDAIMGGKNGINSVKEIIEYDKDAKIIMISAMGQEAIINEAVQAGVKGFITKPFKSENLLGEINNVLNKHIR